MPDVMSDEARRENEACEAVVQEFRSMLAQAGASDPVLRLCDELSGRIALRRHLAAVCDRVLEKTITPDPVEWRKRVDAVLDARRKQIKNFHGERWLFTGEVAQAIDALIAFSETTDAG